MLRIATCISPTFHFLPIRDEFLLSMLGWPSRLTNPSLADTWGRISDAVLTCLSKMIYQMEWSTRRASGIVIDANWFNGVSYSFVFYNTIKRLALHVSTDATKFIWLWWDYRSINFAFCFSTIGFAIIFSIFYYFSTLFDTVIADIFTKDNAFDIAWFIHIKRQPEVNVRCPWRKWRLLSPLMRGLCWWHRRWVNSQNLRWSIFFGSAL